MYLLNLATAHRLMKWIALLTITASCFIKDEQAKVCYVSLSKKYYIEVSRSDILQRCDFNFSSVVSLEKLIINVSLDNKPRYDGYRILIISGKRRVYITNNLFAFEDGRYFEVDKDELRGLVKEMQVEFRGTADEKQHSLISEDLKAIN